MQNRVSCLTSAILGILLVGLTIPSFSVSASEEVSGEERVFRFNISLNGYPSYLIVDQNQSSGIMWDVVSVVAKRLGYRVIAERIPRKRVDQMLLEGYIDGTPRAREWADNPEQFLFTDPVVDIEEVFFAPAQSDFSYESPDDLVSKTIVTHLGYRYPLLEPYFEEGRVRRFDVSRDKDMFTFVLHGDLGLIRREHPDWIVYHIEDAIHALRGQFEEMIQAAAKHFPNAKVERITRDIVDDDFVF
jgi:polar amino acid transport system substrate-binding protein